MYLRKGLALIKCTTPKNNHNNTCILKAHTNKRTTDIAAICGASNPNRIF